MIEPDNARAPQGFPGPNLARLKGPARTVAALALGFALLIALLLPVGWWSGVTPEIRDFLEAMPLGDAVATTASEVGDPLLIALLAGTVVVAAIWAASMWRRRSVRAYLWGGNTFVSIFAVGMVRTVVIFGGLTLIPILAVVANGTDLREDPSNTFTGPLWPVLVILGWCVFNFVDLQRVHNREAERGQLSESLPSGFIDELREIVAARSFGPQLLKSLALLAAAIAFAVWLTAQSLGSSPGETASDDDWWLGFLPWIIVFAAGSWVVRRIETQARRLRELHREKP